jgi:hypothetical protein
MELLHRRCCGLDVHKETVVACLRLVSDKISYRQPCVAGHLVSMRTYERWFTSPSFRARRSRRVPSPSRSWARFSLAARSRLAHEIAIVV